MCICFFVAVGAGDGRVRCCRWSRLQTLLYYGCFVKQNRSVGVSDKSVDYICELFCNRAFWHQRIRDGTCLGIHNQVSVNKEQCYVLIKMNWHVRSVKHMFMCVVDSNCTRF